LRLEKKWQGTTISIANTIIAFTNTLPFKRDEK